MSKRFTIRRGDRRPSIAYQFPFSLVDAVSVSFSLRDEATQLVFIDDRPAVIANGTYEIGELTVLTPASGVVFYPWAAGDTDEERRSCMGLFHITWPGGLQETLPSDGYIPVTIGPNF